ncbi:MAG: zinc dependent phospholipase C family protein [Candidatus Acidiferrales bacterium]
MSSRFSRLLVPLLILLLLFSPGSSRAFSVLTHEAIIDSAWKDSIRPLLLKRFPNATNDELREAHAYAYGGSIIQDMGYYPFGSHLFSDLVHYVRTGDFIETLIRDSNDLNEYAFALGTVAHYTADNNGHRIAVNRSVPILYPKLQRRYGDVVTYDENPAAHLKTEFGFDVLQVAKGHYAPDSYHDYIGFQIAQPLLERAFQETYAIELKSIFSSYDLAIATYRHSVSSLIPKMTKVAWNLKKDEIQRTMPGITEKNFLYHLSRASYEKNWKEKYQEPGFGTKLLSFLILIIPKIGPFRALSFRTPTPKTEKMFEASFNQTITEYGSLMQRARENGRVDLMNDNFDTGNVTGPGQYPLADKTYAALLDHLAENHFAQVSPELRSAVLSYYSNLNAPFSNRKNKKDWAKVVQNLDELKSSVEPKPATPTD